MNHFRNLHVKHMKVRLKYGYNAVKKKGMVTVFDWGKYHEAIKTGKLSKELKPVPFDNKGSSMRAVWDISILASTSKERTGYPTQKPVNSFR